MTRFIRNQMQTYIAINNTILLNDRQRNRRASKQDKWRRLGLYANEESLPEASAKYEISVET